MAGGGDPRHRDWSGTGQRRRSPGLGEAARAGYGTRFGEAAGLYHRVRPSYPEAVYDWIEQAVAAAGEPGEDDARDPRRAVDVGAGTGLFGAGLRSRGWEVIGVDPDAGLLAHHPAPALLGTAESLPVPDGSCRLVTAAQAWHWLDPEAASAEFIRVLTSAGTAVVVLNQLDVRVEWVLRLSRIMHAGDVFRPQWRPALTGFGSIRSAEFPFSTHVTVDDIVALAATRTYWLRSEQGIRARVEANLRQFLSGEGRELAEAAGHLVRRPSPEHGHAVGEPDVLELPYACLAYASRVR